MFIFIGDVEQIFDLIGKTYGHNFIMINTDSDYSDNLNDKVSPAMIVKKFVRKRRDINYYHISSIMEKIIFFITKYEIVLNLKNKLDSESKRF
ncbi:4750_t:CDS:2 [Cetraspora pellucida]|uniref:4750_t:CDS:1 n=1 Tax=Cetraspora pellucida TaxID=1433469 RepID=A0ACA9KB65_9GLOM|nr:4750_t:CDS:2 [Cetraspora pellucida]